jgi:hypothetical protein
VLNKASHRLQFKSKWSRLSVKKAVELRLRL